MSKTCQDSMCAEKLEDDGWWQGVGNDSDTALQVCKSSRRGAKNKPEEPFFCLIFCFHQRLMRISKINGEKTWKYYMITQNFTPQNNFLKKKFHVPHGHYACIEKWVHQGFSRDLCILVQVSFDSLLSWIQF